MTFGRFAAAPISDAALAGVNHFHPIRLVAALLVLFAHAFHLLDRAGDEPIGYWFMSIDASLLGVTMFFFVSGFLVARSWDARRSLGGFVAARVLRIIPALWLALLLTVLVIGPTFTTLSSVDYFTNTATWKYLGLNALLRPQYLLPGVFETNPLPGVNGSLWTIPLEAACYAVLGVAGWTALLFGPGAAVVARFRASPIGFLVQAFVGAAIVVKIAITSPTYGGLALEFMLGMIVYRVRERIRLYPLVALILVVVSIATARVAWPFLPAGTIPTIGAALTSIALPYALLTLGLHPGLTTRVSWLHRHDYSYGTYLYGFPVQQAAIALGVRDPWTLLAIGVPASVVLAALSWHLVEKRALALKGV